MAHNDNVVAFKKGDYVVYPAHGVGQIDGVETQKIGGMEIELYSVSFAKDRMRLKVPTFKVKEAGLRKISSAGQMDSAMDTLKGKSRVRRIMWSRRAAEYDMKINSGDPVAIAEVLRDLKRNSIDSEQSYSERQIYESALARLGGEVAALENISETAAMERLEDVMGVVKPSLEDLSDNETVNTKVAA
jgi:CarD family transcriptional regulator